MTAEPFALDRVSRKILGPTCAAAVELFRRPSLPNGVRYALLMRPGYTPLQKPLVFANLGELARALHRRRKHGGLQLIQTELLVRERDTPLTGVSVWTLEPSTGDRRTFIGWAFLGGAGRISLEASLQAEQPGPVH